MLAQHLITKPVFDALFEDYSFAEHNPCLASWRTCSRALDDQNLDGSSRASSRFYESVRSAPRHRQRPRATEDHHGALREVLKIAFPRTADKLGSSTPVEIVDWLLL
jgi:predicted helicase